MTYPDGTTAATEAPVKPAPLWEDFIDIFYAPSEVFARRRNANPWPALLIITILWLVISLVTFDQIAPMVETATRRAMEKAMAGNAQMTADMVDMAVRRSAQIAPWSPILTPIMALLAAGVVWLLGKIVGSRATYTQSLVITTYLCFTFVIGSLVTGVQAMVMDMNAIDNPMQLSLSAARGMDLKTTPALLYGLASALELFGLWRLFLLARGYQVIGKTSKAGAWTAAAVALLLMILLAVRQAVTLKP